MLPTEACLWPRCVLGVCGFLNRHMQDTAVPRVAAEQRVVAGDVAEVEILSHRRPFHRLLLQKNSEIDAPAAARSPSPAAAAVGGDMAVDSRQSADVHHDQVVRIISARMPRASSNPDGDGSKPKRVRSAESQADSSHRELPAQHESVKTLRKMPEPSLTRPVEVILGCLLPA